MVHRDPDRTVVAGVDGSDAALRAARWAAAEARRRGVALRLVLAFADVDDTGVGSYSERTGRRMQEILLDHAHARLREAAGAVRLREPGLPVEELLVIGCPVEILVDASRRAELVVLGDQGAGRVRAVLTGAVAVAVHAACPVVVVRGPERAGTDAMPVVVGIDASAAGQAALDFACAMAVARDVPLVAVRAIVDHDPVPVPMHGDDTEITSARRRLLRLMDAWSEKYPELVVQTAVVGDRPAHQLVLQSANAQLLVVGSRGHGELARLVLGSVSNAVVHAAACPVAVVRGHDLTAAVPDETSAHDRPTTQDIER